MEVQVVQGSWFDATPGNAARATWARSVEGPGAYCHGIRSVIGPLGERTGEQGCVEAGDAQCRYFVRCRHPGTAVDGNIRALGDTQAAEASPQFPSRQEVSGVVHVGPRYLPSASYI